MLFPPTRRRRHGKDARAESEREPENRADERGAEGNQPQEGAAFGRGAARDDGVMRAIAMSGLGMLMILGMSVSGIMRVIVADMVVGMHDALHQLMRVLRQPAVRFQADMEHRGEPGQGQEQRKDGSPIAHAFTVAATQSGNTNRNQALRDKQRYLSPAATTLRKGFATLAQNFAREGGIRSCRATDGSAIRDRGSPLFSQPTTPGKVVRCAPPPRRAGQSSGPALPRRERGARDRADRTNRHVAGTATSAISRSPCRSMKSHRSITLSDSATKSR